MKEAPAPESRSGFQMQPVRVKSSILHSSSFVSSGLGLIFMEVHEFCPSEKRHTQASHSHQRANRGHGGSQGFSPPCSPPDDDPPMLPPASVCTKSAGLGETFSTETLEFRKLTVPPQIQGLYSGEHLCLSETKLISKLMVQHPYCLHSLSVVYWNT